MSLLLSVSVGAQDTIRVPQGSMLRIQPRAEREWIVGPVDRITSDAISLQSCSNCTTLVFPWARVERAEVLTRRGLSKGQRVTLIVVAGVAGATAGAAVGGAIGARADRRCKEVFCGVQKPAHAGLLGVLGALGGLSFGVAWRRDRWQLLLMPAHS